MIVLLIIVALLVLLLVVPFGFSARYVDGEASVAARVASRPDSPTSRWPSTSCSARANEPARRPVP